MSGVCDITRCLFDDNLYVAAPHSATVLPERLLAVAGLQEAHEFEFLNQVVQHRRTQAQGDSQEHLSLMKWAVQSVFDAFVERSVNGNTRNKSKDHRRPPRLEAGAAARRKDLVMAALCKESPLYYPT